MILDWLKAIAGYGVRYAIRVIVTVVVLTVFLFVMARMGLL